MKKLFSKLGFIGTVLACASFIGVALEAFVDATLHFFNSAPIPNGDHGIIAGVGTVITLFVVLFWTTVEN